MRSVIVTAAMLACAAMCPAGTWNGRLVDAGCMDRNQRRNPNPCGPNRTTTTFGVELSDGRMLRLDGAGNARIADVMKHDLYSGAAIGVTVTGSLEDGNVVRVESVDLDAIRVQ